MFQAIPPSLAAARRLSKRFARADAVAREGHAGRPRRRKDGQAGGLKGWGRTELCATHPHSPLPFTGEKLYRVRHVTLKGLPDVEHDRRHQFRGAPAPAG